MTELRTHSARQKIAALAAEMIGGNLSYLEGAARIVELRSDAGMENDPDIVPFVFIESETDALPLGAQRDLWKPSVLAALQPKMDSSEAWAEEICREHCRNLIKRLREV